MASLYKDLVRDGIPTDHHESDLYILDTPEARKLVKTYGYKFRAFMSDLDGQRWIDVPFAYEPFWEKKEQARRGAPSGERSLKAATRTRHHSTVKTEPITDVVFRVFPEGDVIALFPKDKYGPRTINSYQHVGQHGEASPALIKELRSATPAEYAPLLAELKSIGYRPRIDKTKSAGGARARVKDLEWRDSPRRGPGVLTAQGRGGRGSGYYEIELHQGHTVRYHSPDGSTVLTGPHAGGLKFAKAFANDHNRHTLRK